MTDASGNPCHFSFPFGRGADGKLVTDVQDSDEHVMSQVQTVVRFPLGFRIDRPAFGITFPVFANAPIDASAIAAQVKRQVPDSDLSFEEYADAVDESVRHVRLTVGS
jgi:phage baseplate assembly protein W